MSLVGGAVVKQSLSKLFEAFYFNDLAHTLHALLSSSLGSKL